MMRTVYLHGSLGEKFGKVFRFDIECVVEAGRALCQLAGFEKYVLERKYHVIRGEYSKEFYLGPEDVTLGLGSATEIHIVPYLEGADKGGIGKIVVGAVLVAVAIAGAVFTGGGSLAAVAVPLSETFAITYGQVLMAGVAILFAGVSQAIAASAKSNYGGRERTQDQLSFLFNGASNVTEQGHPIPLVYGKIRTGSITASAGIWVERFTPTT